MIEFLGRAEELARIQAAIKAWGERQIIILSGPGGIGKTRLLREISNIYQRVSRTHILDIIDFDLPIYEIPHVVVRAIARQLPSADFAPYFEALQRRQLAEEGGGDPIRLLPQTLDIQRSFVACFNRVAAQERIVIRFDTVEKMQQRAQLSTLLDLLLQLENAVIVFAGRSHSETSGFGLEAFYRELERQNAGRATLHPIELTPFDTAIFQVYVDKKQTTVGLHLDKDWRATLAMLAGGRPILIDLAVELGNRIAAADWLRDLKERRADVEALQHSRASEAGVAFTAIRQRFDQELVANIINIQGDIDRLKVLLALIAPLNTESIADILQVSPDQAQSLFAEASRSVSFKIVTENLIALHDAVRELLLQYVIPELDPDHEREHTYLERAITSFERQARAMLVQMRRLKAEEEQARATSERERGLALFEERSAAQRVYQQLSMRIIEFAFRLDPLQGAERLEQELQIARQHGIFSTDLQSLFNVVQTYLPALEQQSVRHYIRVQILLAAQHVLDGQYELAEEIYNRIEARVTETTPLRFEILDNYGDIQMGIGKAQAALQHYQKAVELARQLRDDSLLGQALLSCGWATRVLGQLDNAIHFYQQAFGLTLKIGGLLAGDTEDVLLQRARALNGLAYVYAIQGKRRTAIDSLNQAIDIRRKIGDSGRFALAQSYTTAGEMYTDLEQPQEALRYLVMAEDLFAELGSSSQPSAEGATRHSQWAAKIASARGRAYWALSGETEDADQRQQYLGRAEAELEQAVALSIAADLPKARYRLGNVYSADPSRRDLAVQTWRQSYQDARDFGDIFIELNSVCQLARMAIYGLETGYRSYQDFETWLAGYQERNQGAHFLIVEGCFAIYRGCLALQSGDAETAFQSYRYGLGVLVEQPKQSIYSFDWQLRFLEREVLPACAPQTVRAVWSRLLDDWMAQGKGVEAWTTFQRWQHWQL